MLCITASESGRFVPDAPGELPASPLARLRNTGRTTLSGRGTAES